MDQYRTHIGMTALAGNYSSSRRLAALPRAVLRLFRIFRIAWRYDGRHPVEAYRMHTGIAVVDGIGSSWRRLAPPLRDLNLLPCPEFRTPMEVSFEGASGSANDCYWYG
jgi:hypothetical protein